MNLLCYSLDLLIQISWLLPALCSLQLRLWRMVQLHHLTASKGGWVEVGGSSSTDGIHASKHQLAMKLPLLSDQTIDLPNQMVESVFRHLLFLFFSWRVDSFEDTGRESPI